jgi:Lhr-like helicase
LLVDEVFGRPQTPRWLGSGVPMPNELARRIFLFRTEAAEWLRDGEPALASWLHAEHRLGASASASLARYVQQQETVSEIPVLSALLIESVSMQSCTEYFVHTPLPRSANEALARVMLHRWIGPPPHAFAADLGIYLLIPGESNLAPDSWRRLLDATHFALDFHAHLSRSDLLQQTFARIAQTGLLVLRNLPGRKHKVGGKDGTRRRLFEQLRERAGDFVLLRQAEREAIEGACDLAAALAYVAALTNLPIRARQLAKPSPFGESLLQGGMRGEAIAPPPNPIAPHYEFVP